VTLAVSRQVTTPSINGTGGGVLDEKRPLDDYQSHSHERVAETHDVQTARGQLLVDGCSGGRGRGVGGCYGHAAPVDGWSLAGAAGMPANLGSDSVTSHHHMM
jgi:hypothetical protein